MRNHALRPFLVIIGMVVVIMAIRLIIVPADFGTGDRGYMYGWHRAGNEAEWKAFAVKYKFNDEYCRDCHFENYDAINQSPHVIVKCENCHGPAYDHPASPPKLEIDKSRQQCLRCHASLPYHSSDRANIKGIDPDDHHPDMECSMCHNPHNPVSGESK